MSKIKFKRTVKCPECAQKADWSEENIFKPFCSKRCQLLDLGSWVNEKHVIPGESLINLDQEYKDQ